jgi:hypothetical protein
MESLSECYVVHFISETRILYHVSETKVNARIEKFLSCQPRADFDGVWIGSFKGERSALLGLHGIDAAARPAHPTLELPLLHFFAANPLG